MDGEENEVKNVNQLAKIVSPIMQHLECLEVGMIKLRHLLAYEIFIEE